MERSDKIDKRISVLSRIIEKVIKKLSWTKKVIMIKLLKEKSNINEMGKYSTNN